MSDQEPKIVAGGIDRHQPGKSVRPYGSGDFAKCVALNALRIPAAAASPGLIAALK